MIPKPLKIRWNQIKLNQIKIYLPSNKALCRDILKNRSKTTLRSAAMHANFHWVGTPLFQISVNTWSACDGLIQFYPDFLWFYFLLFPRAVFGNSPRWFSEQFQVAQFGQWGHRRWFRRQWLCDNAISVNLSVDPSNSFWQAEIDLLSGTEIMSSINPTE